MFDVARAEHVHPSDIKARQARSTLRGQDAESGVGLRSLKRNAVAGLTIADSYLSRAAKSRGDIVVLGKIDPVRIYDAPLTLEVGDGTNGNFPLCGPMRKEIGWEAVTEWRRVHDAQAFSREVVEGRAQLELMEAMRLAEQRMRRNSKRGNA